MPLVSFGVLTSGCAVWSLYSPTHVLENYPRIFTSHLEMSSQI